MPWIWMGSIRSPKYLLNHNRKVGNIWCYCLTRTNFILSWFPVVVLSLTWLLFPTLGHKQIKLFLLNSDLCFDSHLLSFFVMQFCFMIPCIERQKQEESVEDNFFFLFELKMIAIIFESICMLALYCVTSMCPLLSDTCSLCEN